jgi:hypothetical protein
MTMNGEKIKTVVHFKEPALNTAENNKKSHSGYITTALRFTPSSPRHYV